MNVCARLHLVSPPFASGRLLHPAPSVACVYHPHIPADTSLGGEEMRPASLAALKPGTASRRSSLQFKHSQRQGQVRRADVHTRGISPRFIGARLGAPIHSVYLCAGRNSAGKEIQPTAEGTTGGVGANPAAAQIVAVGNVSSLGHAHQRLKVLVPLKGPARPPNTPLAC